MITRTGAPGADSAIRTQPAPARFRLPDRPERGPDDMTSAKHLAQTGNMYLLARHLGRPETTIVAGDRYLVVRPTQSMAGSRYPDLLVAFDASPAAFEASNGYVIAEQGKPPDLVLEIASRATGREDVRDKPGDYAALGVPEYWRFDETGEHHGVRLAGDRLMEGAYAPIGIEELPDGVLQGRSDVLNLLLRWEDGSLTFHDPATGRHIATLDTERERAVDAETRAADAETRVANAETRAANAETRAEAERAARLRAEARIRQLEALLSGDENHPDHPERPDPSP